MKLIIVRHGESVNNAKHIIGGQEDYPLTKKGLAQAKKVAKRLKNETIDIAFVSPLRRGLVTAEEILKFHPNLTVCLDRLLEEMNFGRLQGKPTKVWQTMFDSYKGNINKLKPPGGESMSDLVKRVKLFLKKLDKYNSKIVLVVAHGRLIRAILHSLLGIRLDEIMKTHFFNTSVTILNMNKSKIKIETYNSVKHLNVI